MSLSREPPPWKAYKSSISAPRKYIKFVFSPELFIC